MGEGVGGRIGEGGYRNKGWEGRETHTAGSAWHERRRL